MSHPSPGGWPDPYSPGSSPAGAPPPVYPQTAYGPPGYGYQPYPMPAVRPTNGLAIAALICSLSGMVVGLSAPVGAILGHVALRQIRERGEEGQGMALAGVIVGWVITGLYAVGCAFYLVMFAWLLQDF